MFGKSARPPAHRHTVIPEPSEGRVGPENADRPTRLRVADRSLY
jgi:hypothetical protein